MFDLDEFNAEYGMTLLQNERFDEALTYFESNLQGNAVAYYGLALTKFRRNVESLNIQQAAEIVGLYESAIALSPSFADAYFMCGMAYNALATFQLGSFNTERSLLSAVGLSEVDAQLANAEAYFYRAVKLKPGFAEIAEGELEKNQMLVAFSKQLRNYAHAESEGV